MQQKIFNVPTVREWFMSSELHRMVILVNTETGYAYPTGNQKAFKAIDDTATAQAMRLSFYKHVVDGSDPSKNYSSWAESVRQSGLENFFIVVVIEKTKQEAEAKASKIIKDNRWIDASLQTYATKI